jgi:hypothetical protein
MRPFVRFWARFFDVFLPLTLLAIILNLAAPGWRDYLWLNLLWLSFLSVLVWIPIEAYCLLHWGTTPGKSLLRVKVVWRRHNAHNVWLRVRGVWTRGMGGGVPILGQLMQLISLINIDKGTPWDHAAHTEISHQPIGSIRVVACALILLTLDAIGFGGVFDLLQRLFLMEPTNMPFFVAFQH